MSSFDPLLRYSAPEAAPDFSMDVPTDGYRWWYVDGISDDGQNGIVIIAFIGSVFSPYYFAARGRGVGDPLEHCAINVGLYRRGGKRWCMTERGRPSLRRGADFFRVGPSELVWRDGMLTIEIDERSTPFGRRVRGRVRLSPHFLNAEGFYLDKDSRHRWRPIAPSSSIDVELESPALRWRGHGYFDSNAGTRPLEDDFHGWSWTRREVDGGSDMTYSIEPRAGRRRATSIRVVDGDLIERPLPAEVKLPSGLWRVQRSARCGRQPAAMRDLEDTPFYTRSILTDTEFPGDTMHEYLDLDRFRSRWVRLLLPFRMPRLR